MAETKQSFAGPQHGTFCWMELSSTNVEAAKKFYTELLGWNLKMSDAVPGFEYTEFYNGERPLGGMYQLTEECKEQSGEPMKSHWMAYVAVDNVDDAASRVFDLGGKICVPPMDIPNVGRFCVINDPSGATLSLIAMKQ
jgi:predicted enzyme related to lactoylglutathione lyase